MSSAHKALELQRQVRQNAEEYRKHVTDLNRWQKEIKNKEQALKDGPAPTCNGNDSQPVRSHVPVQNLNKEKSPSNNSGSAINSPGGSTASTPTEKQDLPMDPLAQQHKKANDIKDRGNNFVKVADYDRAIEAYTEAVSVYPYDSIYYINRALCYLKQERYDNCIEDCDSAISLNKLCVKAYYRRMQANESLGNNMEALKDCTTVLAIDPKNVEGKKSLQRINDRLRKIERADLIDILPIEKPAYKRSKKPLHRVPIVDIVTPRAPKEEPKELRISDEDIDKIFNSYCGPYVEVKKPRVKTLDNTTIQTKVDVKDTSLIDDKSFSSANNKQDIIHKQSVPHSKIVPEKIVHANTKKNNNPTEIEQQNDPTYEIRTLPPAPTGTAQFYINWKELSAAQKYQYLKSIDLNKLCKILGAGFDSETLTDILRTLKEYYIPNNEPTTAGVLLEMSKNDEFTILAMLMSTEEKKMVSAIMDAVQSSPEVNPTLLSTLKNAYNLV
ncbi:RNA polymerase II-associated protein 3 isoform X2 [Scaptodrosophila lebanonensis]|uniref:RNA polymerase II-associated protein 3 n=1 Tax=Drosophila lebanonensis TaxID=7225 RepID=A0A6J2UF07_DROLE|nr:RNA polymerase II-associated protein 3 isoform X2 [Scaptodrosophila lebanonensis]